MVMYLHKSSKPIRRQLSRLAHPLQAIESKKLVAVTLDTKTSWEKHVTNTIWAALHKHALLKLMKFLGVTQKTLRDIRSYLLPLSSPNFYMPLLLDPRPPTKPNNNVLRKCKNARAGRFSVVARPPTRNQSVCYACLLCRITPNIRWSELENH